MIIKDLHIENYRLFEDFNMEGLAQVNLIAGKNNTGKTALLEALRIWASEGDNTVINHVLQNRGDFTPGWFESYEGMINRSFAPKNGNRDVCVMKINKLELWVQLLQNNRIGRYYFPRNGKEEYTLNSSYPTDFPNDGCSYIPFPYEIFPLQYLWEKIVLTPEEDDVLRIIKLIDPNIERIHIKDDKSKVLMAESEKPIPVKNLGDGAIRVLTIAIGLVNAKNRLMLIDEIDLGLHYSVQEQLWDIIFEYAKKWNIQVFATTHSMDTIKSFFYVSRKEEFNNIGKYFRLQRSRQGKIEAVPYNEEELEVALEVNLEPRG